MIEKYKDILHRLHHRSQRHPPMSQWDRAAQFAPFSALPGHNEGTRETARTTLPRVVLTEDAIAQIDRKLQLLSLQLDNPPPFSITYFRPDFRKEGGDYITVFSRLKKIDHHRRCLLLVDGQEIPIQEIMALEW